MAEAAEEEHKAPKNRADRRLSNLILEGGKVSTEKRGAEEPPEGTPTRPTPTPRQPSAPEQQR
ncbi:MAG: hypothetical protein U0821_27505 [Chloroflexota bacterium]